MAKDDIRKTLEGMPTHKVFYFGKNAYDKVVVDRFNAKDDAEAYAYLQDFKNKHHEFDGKQLYYATIHYSYGTGADGELTEPFDLEDYGYRHSLYKSKKPLLKRILEKLADVFSYYFVDIFRSLAYEVRDLQYLLKNKEAYSNQWNLDMHLVDSIIRNVPSLIENSMSMMFIDDAIKEAHSKEKSFDLAKYCIDHYMGYPKEIEDRAMEIQREEYKKLLLHAKLYKYYSEFGHIDFDDKDAVAFDKEWRHTLPIKEGTYDEISDYKKMSALAQNEWDSMWEWVKKHGQKLCD